MSDKHIQSRSWGSIIVQKRDLGKKGWLHLPKKVQQKKKPRHKGRKRWKKPRTNWLAKKKIKPKDRCLECKEITFNLSIKRGHYTLRAAPEVEYSFRTTYMCMRRWRFPLDLIAKIMSMVYDKDVVSRKLTRPIAFLKCGCICHLECLEEQSKCGFCDQYHCNCSRHNQKMEIMKHKI